MSPRIPAALIVLSTLVAGGCGGSDSKPATAQAGAGQSTATKIELPADTSGALKYQTDAVEADAGHVTIVMDNQSSVPHDVAIEGQGVAEKGETVSTGGTSTLELDLKPGKYVLYCSVPGHQQAGMEATLTVR